MDDRDQLTAQIEQHIEDLERLAAELEAERHALGEHLQQTKAALEQLRELRAQVLARVRRPH